MTVRAQAVEALKSARLHTIQALFFVSAVGLFFAGYLLTQRQSPIRQSPSSSI